MRQASLLDMPITLSGLVPAIRAALNNAVGQDEEGRKAFVDRVNFLAARAGVRLTAGNSRSISKDTLDKWLSPSDRDHPPSILALAAICIGTDDPAALRVLANACGFDVVTLEERDILEFAKADLAVEAALQRRKVCKSRLSGTLK